MSHLVAVWCRECKGEDCYPVCGWCMGQKHECIDRARDGGVPEGFTEWIPALLPDLPPPYQRCIP